MVNVSKKEKRGRYFEGTGISGFFFFFCFFFSRNVQ